MKIRLTKKVLADMPPQLRALVQEWSAYYRRKIIYVRNVEKFALREDAKVDVFNLVTEAHQSGRVAGEFAGLTNLRPTDDLDLKVGIIAVQREIFCGVPMLTIYQGINTKVIQ